MPESAVVLSAKIQHPSYMGESWVLCQWEEDGEFVKLFSFFQDELRFSADEFVGKTKAQCEELRHKKDVAYIRS